MKSNLPENFSLLCAQTHHQGTVPTNTGCIWGAQAIPSHFTPKVTRVQGPKQLPQGPWVVWALLQDGHRDCQEGQGEGGEQLTPTSAWNSLQHCQRGSRTQDMCVPKDRSSSVSRWVTGFFPLFILVPKINTWSASQSNSPTDTSTA